MMSGVYNHDGQQVVYPYKRFSRHEVIFALGLNLGLVNLLRELPKLISL